MLAKGVCVVVIITVVGTIVEMVVRSCRVRVSVLGVVLTKVARSCAVTVSVMDALVIVSVFVTVVVAVVVTVETGAFWSVGGVGLGVLGLGVSFPSGMALGMGVEISLAAPGMLGVGRSLMIPAMLGVGTSFPTAGILGADVSFPGSLSFPFLGEKADPIDPRTERGKSLIVNGRELEDWWF